MTQTEQTITKEKKRRYNNVKPRASHVIALGKILEGKGKNIGKALAQAHYSIPTQRNPKTVIETKGFQALLHKQGLTQELVAESLVSDIKGKPLKRVEELKLAADILKMRGNNTAPNDFTPTKILIGTINIHPDAPQRARTHETQAPIPTLHTELPTRTEEHSD